MIPLRLVIGGAPRCGTSALFQWLTDHTNLTPSKPKETHFLLEPSHPLVAGRPCWETHGWSWYRRFFEHEHPGTEGWFEGSTHYLYSSAARRALKTLDKPPLIVFSLRDPAEKIHSSFNYAKHNWAAVHQRFSFDDYVRALIDGDKSEIQRWISPPARSILQRQLEYGRYLEHVRSWQEALGSERILVLLFEETIREPSTAVRRICNALGVKATSGPIDPRRRVNPTYRIRFPRVHRGALRLASLLPKGPWKSGIRQAYLALQGQKGRVLEARDARGLEQLRAYFAPHNRALSSEIGIDVSAWGKP
ncbi:MAG: sulfotransferase domain-containing protein [Pseudomonadota bacterium]|nr:MAG: hypothetical protein DIU78_03105 [Pseudomonadota bacterium]